MKTKLITKVSTTVVTLATVVSLSGAGALLPVTVHGQTTADLQAQISALLAQIQALQAQLSAASGAPAASGTVPASILSSGDLTLGSKGAAVKDLQMFLNANGAQVAASGAGSPGNETEYFGSLTRAALAKWQAANGVAPASGYFGPITRAKMSSMSAAAPSTPTTPAPAGTGLTITRSADQPSSRLAPDGAIRVPFTKVTLTASADGSVTLNSLAIERTGLAQDAAFAGIVILDENGVQLGIAKTLNSEHKTTAGESVTIPAGQSRTFTVAANMAADLTSYSGQTASLSVVGANTSAAVNATLPITGTTHTLNTSLTIGTVTMLRGALDPGSAQTKEVGTSGYTFSSIKVTAGSAERVYLKSVRWNQTGSAGSSDMANIKTYVDGTGYDTSISSDGKYYTTVFPGNGLLMDKGFSKEMSIKGDILSGSSRTVAFDVAKRSDLYLIGETYGYGINPPQTNSCGAATGVACFTSGEDPWYDGAVVTVSTGTMTVSTWTGVQAQNLAVNLENQTLGGWSAEVRGESISVANTRFNLTLVEDSGSAVSLADLTNITLFNEAGAVIAGPVDGSGTAQAGTITFTDTVTFPVGTTNLILKGKLGTDFANSDTIEASTTPGTGWTTVTGQTTGNSITPTPSTALSGPTMTVRGASLTATVSSQPTARTVIAGSSNFEFSRYLLDASASGEDLRVSSLPLAYDTTGTATNVTNCALHDGTDASAARLTTGSNIVNPSAVSSSTVFTFDGTGLTIAKGTVKTLSMRCDLASGATGIYRWGLDSGQASTFTGVTGLTSGQTVTETLNDSIGNNMTAATEGSYTVSTDASYLYKIAQAGSTVTLGVLRFTADNTEDLDLKQVALQLGNTASNSPADLVGQSVTLWDGNTQVGSAQFGTSNADNATSTLTSAVRITRGETKNITIKGELAAQNSIEGTPGAFIRVDYDGNNNGLNGNYATGAASGRTISGTSADQTTNGLRSFRTIPTLADVTTNTALAAGADMYAVTVTAGSGRDMGLYKMTFNVATTGATATGFQLYGPSGSVNTAVDSAGDTGGQTVTIVFNTANAADRIVQAGTSKTYRLRANTVTGLTAANVETLNVQLTADTAYADGNGTDHMGTAAGLTGSASFVWTPFSTTTSSVADAAQSNDDWTNGYGAPGFPGLGQDMPLRVFSH